MGAVDSQRLGVKFRKAKTKQTNFPKVVKNSTLPQSGPCYPEFGQSMGH